MAASLVGVPFRRRFAVEEEPARIDRRLLADDIVSTAAIVLAFLCCALGRAVLVAHEALLYLDLRDGSEDEVRRSPVGDVVTVFDSDGTTAAVAAVRDGERRAALVDLAEGTALATIDDPGEGCTYDMAADGGPLVILRWGSIDGCRTPTLLRPGRSGRLDAVAELTAPDGTWAGCDFCRGRLLVGNARAAVVSVSWNSLTAGAEPVRELVRVVDGRVAWRSPVRQGPVGRPALVAITEDAVVAAWDGRWRRLALDDGAEVATQPATPTDRVWDSAATSTPLVDGDHALTALCGEVAVRRLDDLSIAATWGLAPGGCAPQALTPLPDGTVPSPEPDGSSLSRTSDGWLVVQDDRTGLIEAYAPAAADAAPEA